jgi:carboxyl-terminal processing protease
MIPESTNAKERTARERRSFPFLGVALAFFFAAAAFFSGLQVGSLNNGGNEASLASFFSRAQATDDVDLSLFYQVWETLDERFVSSTTTDPATDEERVWGAISGLVESYGDPYTVFMPPEETELFESDIAGEFGGIGMEVGMRDDVVTVIAPLPDTPAERAGIKTGDVLVRIDGVPAEGMSVDEAVLAIRGEPGTEVKLTLFREGESELIELTLTREVINIPTLETEIKDDVYIIRLYNFSATSEAAMQDALRKFMESGKKDLVIDLRGNPGGFLQSAVSIASYFLPTGKVVVRENFGEGKEEHVYRSLGRDLTKYRDIDLAILVNEGSASASEILAGALREHGVATLVGTHTFGKGSVQELIDLPGGSSLKVTIARWLTPNGISISDGGLKPDIEVSITPEDVNAGRDPQLEAALKAVKE